jgi:SNF2 family DNA or RNA helicase
MEPSAYNPTFNPDPNSLAFEINIVQQQIEDVDPESPNSGVVLFHHYDNLRRLQALKDAHGNSHVSPGLSCDTPRQNTNGVGMQNGEAGGDENEGVESPASPANFPRKRSEPPEDLDFSLNRKRVSAAEGRALTLTANMNPSRGFTEVPQNHQMQQSTSRNGNGFGNGNVVNRSRLPSPAPAYAPVGGQGPQSREHALAYQNSLSSQALTRATPAFNPTLRNPTTQNTWTLQQMDNHHDQDFAFWPPRAATGQSGAPMQNDIVDLTAESPEGWHDANYIQDNPAASSFAPGLFNELDQVYSGTLTDAAPDFGQYPVATDIGNVASLNYMTQDELTQLMASTDPQSFFDDLGGVSGGNAQLSSSHQQTGHGYSYAHNRNETRAQGPSNYLNQPAAPHMPQLTADPSQEAPETLNLLLRKMGSESDEVTPPHLREPTPSAMQSQLMEHQKIGLAWMKKMETGPAKGGILGDAMGLGKTIQAIALICARPSEDAAVKTTLIVAPVALLKQWSKEIEHHVRPEHRLSVYSYHGNKNITYSQLCQYDVVLTTYGTLLAENGKLEGLGRSGDPDGRSNKIALLGPGRRWYRVIVDEAQNMKNRNTKTAKAIWELQATYRFCMTGTPMMNSIEDLFSLLKFLQYRPYNEWFKFSIDIHKPIKESNTNPKMREKALSRVQLMLKTIMLRRTKDSQLDGKPMITLPPKHVVQEDVTFSKDELEFYKALEQKSQLKFNKYMKAGTVNHNYASILVLLLRLRQACCHPNLIKDLTATAGIAEEQLTTQAKYFATDEATKNRLAEAEGFECFMCYDGTPNPTIFVPCGHNTCGDCFQKLMDRAGEENQVAKCPICRVNIKADRITDYAHFIKVFYPERLADLGLDIAFNDVDIDSDPESDDGGDQGDDEGDDLDGFIVPDDNGSSEEQEPRANDSRPSNDRGRVRSSRPKKKQTMAELKKASRANIAARQRYLRRLRRGWQSSAKIDKTMEILRKIYEEDPTEKTLIFSQFTSMLDLFSVPLEDAKVGYQRYDGSMSATDRADAVLDFMENDNTRVMLVSLKAGNAGLNLSRASRVIFLDPFWNPYVEDQAVDRAHRMRQNRPVFVYRLLVPETIEDRICQLQEKKRELIGSALDENATKNLATRLGVQDLMYLFRGGA